MQLIDGALSILSAADRHMEITAQNIGNMASPGYRGRHAFMALTGESAADIRPTLSSAVDFSAGKVSPTGNPYDLAIGSDGFFVLRSGSDIRYTRNGQFQRDGDGRLVSGDGWALQSEAGDLVLRSNRITIAADGTVIDDGEPVARIILKDFQSKAALRPRGLSSFEADAAQAIDVADPGIRQAALESANISTAEEMIAMMKALRAAESGQRLVQAYDELLGQAITSFGQVQG